MNEKDLIIQLAKAWNNQDTSFIANLLHDGFKYKSQWVFEEMVGKEKYLQHMDAKFQRIRDGIAQNGDRIEAAIGCCTQVEPDKPCIVLAHTIGGETNKVTLLIKAENSFIKQIDVCSIPEPESARLTGEVPR
jgi:hypothetical protein